MEKDINNTAIDKGCNGAVVCFQKYTIGQDIWLKDENGVLKTVGKHIPDSPACLGYFNRVDVKLIRDFFDYVKETSEHEAGFPCSRKQLLLRKIKENQPPEQIKLLDSEEAGNGLPFVSKDGTPYALCCFSVFSVSDDGVRDDSKKKAKANPYYGDYYAGLANELYSALGRNENKHDFRIMFMELLGTEDLCLIILSNQCRVISRVIEQLQKFNFGNTKAHKPYSKCRVDNVHSILLMDRERTDIMQMVDWGGIRAEMHFSLHAISGMDYLRERTNALEDYLRQQYLQKGMLENAGRVKEEILLESCSGEYDAILRCPAWMLPIVLGLPGEGKIQGCFHPEHEDYRKKIYQSDTYIYPFGLQQTQNNARSNQSASANIRLHEDSDELKRFVDEAVEKLERVFESNIEHKDFRYLKLPIWRLLKEYWSFASFPMSEDLRMDLKYQFMVAVNAIVKEAELSSEAINRRKNKGTFMQKYDDIVRALDASMQAGSQQDRWYFGEQQSYIENVDSYYKILRCYYGMLKNMITLIYNIPRSEGEVQQYLIPLLSFGVNPLIKSNQYDSFIDHNIDPNMQKGERRPAKLVCIRLPYQALSNPLKYLGILAHEIFHYSKPADRQNRNELMLKGLIRVAISEFINILAVNVDNSSDKDFWQKAYINDKGFREIVDNVVHNVYSNVLKPRKLENKQADICMRMVDIRNIVEENELRFTVNPATTKGFECYFRIWMNIRSYLYEILKPSTKSKYPEIMALPALKAEYQLMYEKMFALNELAISRPRSGGELAELRTLYRKVVSKVSDDHTQAARKLLRNTYLAMVECPPDIFDLEVVMAGKMPEDKVRQFYWQQYGAKRDLMAPVCETGEDDGKPLLIKNVIRTAMVISCYLQEREEPVNSDKPKDHPEELEAVLEDWGKCGDEKSTEAQVKFSKAKKEFLEIYEWVYHRFQGLFEDNSMICQQIARRLRKLAQKKATGAIIQDLTKFYEQYYTTLNEYQRESITKNERQDQLFELDCRLIDTYQYQQHFTVKGLTSTRLAKKRWHTSRYLNGEEVSSFGCNETAFSAADLLYKLSLCYERMMVNGKMPQLWYRGQPEAQWQTLPNVMRMDRVKSGELDSEGFAKVLAYQIQLAQAHILPEGDHLSKSEWIAFLQHYEFKTNALDFSESMSPALFFATEKWEDKLDSVPEKDAVIMVFNPVLFNLVMELFERQEQYKAVEEALNLLPKAEEGAINKEKVVSEAQGQLEKVHQALMDALKTQKEQKELMLLSEQCSTRYAAVLVLEKAEADDLRTVLEEQAKDLLGEIAKAEKNLRDYYKNGISYEHPPLFTGATEQEDTTYRYLYDLTEKSYDCNLHPRAVMVPRHCDRMDKQSGEFVYFNLASAKGVNLIVDKNEQVDCICDYSRWSLERLHGKYTELIREEIRMPQGARKILSPGMKFIPFLCRVTVNRYRYRGFKRYVCAMGMHKYSVYPEYDKLAKDLGSELDLQ